MAVASVRLKHGTYARFTLSALQNGSLQPSLFYGRREAHTSPNNNSNSERDEVSMDHDRKCEALNEKPIEEHQQNAKVVAPVPDEVIEAAHENFWVPDPETGVFTPAEESEIDVNNSLSAPPHPTGNGSSILDQTVWVREIEVEEVERPPPTNVEESQK